MRKERRGWKRKSKKWNAHKKQSGGPEREKERERGRERGEQSIVLNRRCICKFRLK